MTPSDAARIEQFITRWQNSSGNERANYQMFFSELCDALGVKRPDVKGSVPGDPYCFDKDITIYHPSGKKTPGYIDFYKADHFLIEAKQGSEKSGKGTAKRGTNAYLKAMEAAFVQAIAYTRNLSSKPPLLLTCDIGDHFELWMGFSGDYGGYGARQDIALTALRKPEIFDLFVDIFTDPQKRNPEKIAAKVTREVAADLAELARKLERSPHPLAPLPEGEGNRNLDWLPSHLGRTAGDEGISKLAGRARQIPGELLRRARELRQRQTSAEKLLWECLRDRRLYNAKFRRQHNLGQFIADFYCHAARLVIELDGGIHQQQQQKDNARDQWMQANGFTVLRFRNEEVFGNTEAVLEAIAQALPSPLTPVPEDERNSPSPLTPLPEGEGNRNLDRLPSPLGRRAGDKGKRTENESIDEIILERLVALNAERAEEERNGFIRWLRPEYQAPGEVHIQQVIEGIAEVQEESAIAPVEQQKFPKAFKDQLAAVRDLLRTQGGEWTVEQIAAQFKGASRQKQIILTCLESLEALGIIAKHEEEGSDRWYLAELQKAG